MNKEDILKAKCPYCENGCDNCVNGYAKVTFGTDEDVMYSLICNNCGENVGGGFLNPQTIKVVNSINKHAICPFCHSKNLKRIIDDE